MKKKTVFMILFVLSVHLLNAQTSWEYVSSIQNEWMRKICTQGLDTVYIVGENGLIAQSTDRGEAQFPAPHNFSMGFHYIYIGDIGYCNGQFMSGPAYCWELQWDTPDLSLTEAQLEGYNVYYYCTENYIEGMEIPSSEVDLLGHTTDIYLQGELGIGRGIVWVTAVYSNPEGESEPSNIRFDNGVRPIAIQEIKSQDISSVDIINLDGITIQSFSTVNFSEKDIVALKQGIYIVRITTNNKVLLKKIIKR
jgi:hypothetical protein